VSESSKESNAAAAAAAMTRRVVRRWSVGVGVAGLRVDEGQFLGLELKPHNARRMNDPGDAVCSQSVSPSVSPSVSRAVKRLSTTRASGGGC